MNDTILTKLYDAIVMLQKDVGDMKVQQAQNTLTIKGTHEQTIKTNGRVNNHDNILESVNKTLAEQIHWNSKLHGSFEAHQQWCKERIKDNKEFAEREINLLRNNIVDGKNTDTEVKVEEIKAKTENWKTASGVVAIVVSLILGIIGVTK